MLTVTDSDPYRSPNPSCSTKDVGQSIQGKVGASKFLGQLTDRWQNWPKNGRETAGLKQWETGADQQEII